MAKLAKKHAKAISDLITRIETAKYFIHKHDSGLFRFWAKEHNMACEVLKDTYGIEVVTYDLSYLEEVQQ